MLHDETIQMAIEYIERHMKEDISLYDIAEHVNFSVPHLYRMFKAIVGETVKTYILKRKLSCAADELKKSKKTISDVAYEYGFESHDVFTRAFNRVYDMSPNKYRNSCKEMSYARFSTDNNSIICERSKYMNFKIIKSNQITVIGMECNAKQWDADGSIGRLWSRFLENVDKIKNPVTPNVMYGICEHESCNESGLTYMAGIEVVDDANIPTGMVKRIIKPHKFIQADIPASVKTTDAYKATSEYAKQKGYEIDVYECDELEVYEEVFQDPDDHAFRLLIPVK